MQDLNLPPAQRQWAALPNELIAHYTWQNIKNDVWPHGESNSDYSLEKAVSWPLDDEAKLGNLSQK